MIPPKGKSTIKMQRAWEQGVSPGGLGEGIQILPYIRRLGPFLGGSNFEFQYFGGFQKDDFFFWGGGEGCRGWGGIGV